MCAFVLVSASQCSAQILHKKKKVDKSTDASNTAEPDKQLYDKAMDDIKHGRHEVGRLSLQTLINTYPDSEYLAKAKLAIADSYFKEGGSANITQAIAGYKDFIVFFPFLPEAAYAQMQVAMANYNEMAKADRDETHAKMAEEEFQTFLQKYPKDPLAPQAEQRLREVQEVIADGQFRIGYFYYVKGDRRAAAGRLAPMIKRYPLYSHTDDAIWMMADVFEKSERKDIATGYYALLVKNYPLSKHTPEAKDKLKAFGAPIPQADPKALAWMTAEQNAPRPKENMIHRSIGIVHSGPDVHSAALSGAPQMEPETDSPDTEILGGGGGRTTLVAGTAGGTSGGGTTGGTSSVGTTSSSGNSSAVVETVRPGDPTPAKSDDTTTSDSSTTSNDPNASSSSTDANSANGSSTASDAAKTDGSSTDGSSSNATNNSTSSSNSTDANSSNSNSNSNASSDNSKESSSKKKGLRKLIPW
jgi:outer membrane protein assembly factor BamD